MIVVENDLIDSFLRGGLTTEEEKLFKQQYSATQARSDRVNISKSFIQIATKTQVQDIAAKTTQEEPIKTEKQSWVRWLQQPIGGFTWARAAITALIVTISIFGGFLLWKYGKEKKEIVRTLAPSPNPLISPSPMLVSTNPTPSPSNENKNTPEKKTPKQEAPKQTIATLILSGGTVRSISSTPTLLIKENTPSVNIKIKVNDASYTSYRGIIKRISNEIIWTGNLSRKGTMVETTISSQTFSQGDYIITVKGSTTEGTFQAFRPIYFKVKVSQ